jgi:hypothetical protein
MPFPVRWVIGFIVLAGLTFAAGALARDEWHAQRQAAISDTALRLDPAQILGHLPRTVESRYRLLSRCDAVMSDRFHPLQPPQTRAAVGAACQSLAEYILRDAPSLSLAHLVRAQALAEQGQDPHDSLMAAHETGGALLWMAARRLRLAFDSVARAALSEMIGADIAKLAKADLGRDFLAALYLQADAGKRAEMSAIFATLAPDVQAQIVAQIRRRL